MARKRRIEFPGAFYHVFARGNNRQKIFKDDDDYMSYLDRVYRYHKRYGFRLFIYLLMPNHVHLVIEMMETPLSKIMQGLQQSFTLYVHKKYKSVGHVFQGRYGAILCDREDYLLKLVSYIHLNPVYSGLVELPDEYVWSSHRAYMGRNGASILESDFVLSLFSDNIRTARREYYRFLLNEMEREKRRQEFDILDQSFYGNQEFVENVKKKLTETNRLAKEVSKGKQELLLMKISMEEILKIVSKATKVSCGCILGDSREAGISRARSFFAYIASRHFGVENRKISAFLSRDSSSITHMVHKMNDCLQKDKELANLLEKVIQVFKV